MPALSASSNSSLSLRGRVRVGASPGCIPDVFQGCRYPRFHPHPNPLPQGRGRTRKPASPLYPHPVDFRNPYRRISAMIGKDYESKRRWRHGQVGRHGLRFPTLRCSKGWKRSSGGAALTWSGCCIPTTTRWRTPSPPATSTWRGTDLWATSKSGGCWTSRATSSPCGTWTSGLPLTLSRGPIPASRRSRTSRASGSLSAGEARSRPGWCPTIC